MKSKVLFLSILLGVHILMLVADETTNVTSQGEVEGNNNTNINGTIIKVEGQLIQCTEERECKAACGSSAMDSRCNFELGNCVCLNEYGPSRRCRNVKHEEEICGSQCKRRIAQVCYTDFGKLCTCFVRN